MRRRLALLAVPALVLGTIAADDPAFEPCDPDDEVVAPGDTLTFEPTGAEAFTFKVDPTTSEKGRVSVDAVLTWTNPLNDWDLGVNGSLSEGFQPLDEPREQAGATARGDCTTVIVEVINFTAVPELELGMTLEVSVR